MTVLAFDVAPDEDAARELGFHYVELDDLLARSDIVTLHVPGNEKTKDLISARQFAKMKDGVVLINTAIDTLLASHILLRMKNVIITPHSAFNTREAVQRILDTTHENTVAFARGKAVNIVN